MPLDLAILGINQSDAIMAAYPDISSWAVGGHSRGGVAAVQYAAKRAAAVDGLVLWAAYPPNSVNLSQSELAVVSILGTNDGLVSQQEIDDSRVQLPASTLFVFIEGGNHAQFGSYGPQKGDRPATISAADQRAQITKATVDLLHQISQSPMP